MPPMHLEPWAETTLRIAAILVGAVVAYVLLRTAFGAAVRHLLQRRHAEPAEGALSALEAERRVRTLERLAVRVTGSVIAVIALLMVLSEVEIDVGPAVAGLGVVGIAVGFGAQTLIRDWLAGIFVVLENQYSAGDVVRIAGVEGVVEDFSLRRTTLRDADGTVHTVPNGQIIVASNLSRGDRLEPEAADDGVADPADGAEGRAI
jgi:small conductance mechanosensitive channel